MHSLLGNYAVPGLVVTTQDRSLSEEQAEQIKNSVSERFSGTNRGKVGVLNNGATVAQFGFSPPAGPQGPAPGAGGAHHRRAAGAADHRRPGGGPRPQHLQQRP